MTDPCPRCASVRRFFDAPEVCQDCGATIVGLARMGTWARTYTVRTRDPQTGELISTRTVSVPFDSPFLDAPDTPCQ